MYQAAPTPYPASRISLAAMRFYQRKSIAKFSALSLSGAAGSSENRLIGSTACSVAMKKPERVD